MQDITGKQVKCIDLCAWSDTMLGVVFASDIPQNQSLICFAFILTFSLVIMWYNPKFLRQHMCFRHMGKNKQLGAP